MNPGAEPVIVDSSNLKDFVVERASQYYRAVGALPYFEELMKSATIEAVYSPAELPSGSDIKYVYWLITSKYVPDGPPLFIFEQDTVFEGEQFSPGVYLDARKGGFGASIFNADFTEQGGAGYPHSIVKICDYYPGVLTSASVFSFSLGLPDKWAPVLPAEGAETVPMVIPGAAPAEALDVDALAQEILKRLSQNELEVKPSDSQIVDPGTQPDTKPSINPGTDTEGLGLFGWLKRIWQSIVALPAQIGEKIGAFFTTLWGWLQSIIDAITALPAAIAEKIKALFVPREGYAAEFVADITATYQGRMGLLTYPFTVLADFVGTVATLEEQEPVLRWDAVEWQNKTIIAAGEYNLKSAVSSAQMQTVYMIYKTVVSGMLVVAFLHLCYKKLKEVQRN